MADQYQGIPEVDIGWLHEMASRLKGVSADQLAYMAVHDPTGFAKLAVRMGVHPPPAEIPSVGKQIEQLATPSTAYIRGAGYGHPITGAPPVAPPASPVDQTTSQGDRGSGAADLSTPAATANPQAKGGGTQGGAGASVPQAQEGEAAKTEGDESGIGQGPYGGRPTATSESTTTDPGATSSSPGPNYSDIGKTLSGIKAPQRPGYLPPVSPPYHPAVTPTNPIGEMLAAVAQQRQQPSLKSLI